MIIGTSVIIPFGVGINSIIKDDHLLIKETDFTVPNLEAIDLGIAADFCFDSNGTMHLFYIQANRTQPNFAPSNYLIFYQNKTSDIWSSPVPIYSSPNLLSSIQSNVDLNNTFHLTFKVEDASWRYLTQNELGWQEFTISQLGIAGIDPIIKTDFQNRVHILERPSSNNPVDLVYHFRNKTKIRQTIRNTTFLNDSFVETQTTYNNYSQIQWEREILDQTPIHYISDYCFTLDPNQNLHILFEGSNSSSLNQTAIYYVQYRYDEQLKYDYNIYNQTNANYTYEINITTEIEYRNGSFINFQQISPSDFYSYSHPMMVYQEKTNKIMISYIRKNSEHLHEITIGEISNLINVSFQEVSHQSILYNLQEIRGKFLIDEQQGYHYVFSVLPNSSLLTFSQQSLIHVSNQSQSWETYYITRRGENFSSFTLAANPKTEKLQICAVGTALTAENNENQQIIMLSQKMGLFSRYFQISAQLAGSHVSVVNRSLPLEENETIPEYEQVIVMKAYRDYDFQFLITNPLYMNQEINLDFVFRNTDQFQLKDSQSAIQSIVTLSAQTNASLNWKFEPIPGDNQLLNVDFVDHEESLFKLGYLVDIKDAYQFISLDTLFIGILIIFSGLYWFYQSRK